VVHAGFVRGDRLLGLVLALHLPFALALAPWYDSWTPALAAGGLLSGVAFGLTRFRPGRWSTRAAVGLAFMGYSALVIHQSAGMIEFHFHIFASLAFLTIYRDWTIPVLAAAAIAVHHVGFHVLQHAGWPVYVFPVDEMHGWGIVAVHAAFVVFETVILVFLSRMMREEAEQGDELVRVAGALERGELRVSVTPGGGAMGAAVQALTTSLGALAETVGGILDGARTVAREAERLSGTSQELRAASEQLDDRARRLDRAVGEQLSSAEEMGAASTHVQAAVQQVSGGAEVQARDTDEMAGSTEVLARSVDDIAHLTGRVREQAHRASGVAENGREVVVEALSAMRELRGAVDEAATQVGSLEERSGRIHQILKELQEISQQTNLLALNASVEAARAGEHGLGFAVVAEAVRELANRAAGSTAEIGGLLEGIRTGTAAVAATMARGTRLAETSSGHAETAGRVLEDVVGATKESAADVERIAGFSQEISHGGQELGRRVQSVAVVTRQTAEAVAGMRRDTGSVAASAERIVASARSSAASARDVAQGVGSVATSAVVLTETAQGLDDTARRLMEAVARFSL
jgi:methyl-accepting chemotaxis protein